MPISSTPPLTHHVPPPLCLKITTKIRKLKTLGSCYNIYRVEYQVKRTNHLIAVG